MKLDQKIARVMDALEITDCVMKAIAGTILGRPHRHHRQGTRKDGERFNNAV
jgi:hypothetical protein